MHTDEQQIWEVVIQVQTAASCVDLIGLGKFMRKDDSHRAPRATEGH